MNFLEKIDAYRRRNGNMSQTTFEKTAGLSPGQMTKWRNNGFTPNHASQIKLAQTLGITIEELMRVTDDSEPALPPLSACSAAEAALAAESPAIYVYKETELAALQAEFPDKSTGLLKLIPYDPAPGDSFFAVRISDDSMTPEIRNGDTAIIRRQSEAAGGDIVLVYTPGESAVCRKLVVVEAGGGIILEAFNRAFDSRYYSSHDTDILPVNILGKVISILRYYE